MAKSKIVAIWGSVKIRLHFWSFEIFDYPVQAYDSLIRTGRLPLSNQKIQKDIK